MRNPSPEHAEHAVTESIFKCQKCGKCCEGRGGIILGDKDIKRISVFLKMEADALKARYTMKNPAGKLALITGADGFCIFFKQGLGCKIHECKPDVCRAWPFFRGNLTDEFSFAMAREFCPGINPMIPHQLFKNIGMRWLERENLSAHDKTSEANALIIKDL